MIKCVACVAKDYGLGKNNGLLFNIKADMKHFVDLTREQVVVMGLNTLLSFPKSKPLKNRINIVLCPEEIQRDDCICVHDFEEMVKQLKLLSHTFDFWIIGGGMLYKSMLPYYDEIYLTKVDAVDPEATVFFPNIDEDIRFEITEESEEQEENGYRFKFVTYKRK